VSSEQGAPLVLHLLLAIGSHIPVHSASVWHVEPLPEQNPIATHFPLSGQSCVGLQLWPLRLPPWHSPESQVPPGHWQAKPSRVPPWHCPSVSAPHVPAQSARLKQIPLSLLPPWQIPNAVQAPPGQSVDVLQILPLLVPPEQRVVVP